MSKIITFKRKLPTIKRFNRSRLRHWRMVLA